MLCCSVPTKFGIFIPIIPIVKAAGGIISTWKNEDAVKAGNILVSANKLIHERIIKLLKPVGK